MAVAVRTTAVTVLTIQEIPRTGWNSWESGKAVVNCKVAYPLSLVALVLAWPAHSHHSFATHYDTNNIVEIEGVLSDVKMRNPHSFFEVDVASGDGSTVTWEVEAHAVPILRRLGITRDTLKVGDSVKVRGPRSRLPEKFLLFGAEISTASGMSFEMLDSIRRPPENAVTDSREGVFGVDRLVGKWMTFIEGQRVADSPMPLSAAAEEARRNFDPKINPASDCVPPNLPSALMLPYVYEISRDGDTILLFHEYSRIRRPVVLGDPAGNVTDPTFGRRVGRFEDDTLIIESANFPAHGAGLASGWEPNGNGKDVPGSAGKTLVERYRVNEDGSKLIVDYTVSDPVYLTAPFTARVEWYRLPDDAPIYDFTCDAGIAKRSTENAAVLKPN